VADVALRTVRRVAVAAWADGHYATIPPVAFQPPANRWRRLPRTLKRLRSGGRLRIVMLGDSIVNDTGNSPYDVLLERVYPKARIEVVTSVRGGTGCPYYRDENRVKPHVLDYQPDLVLIGGISHGCDVEAVRSVVRQIRSACDAEILVLTGAVAPRALQNENLAKEAKKRGDANAPTIEEYQRNLAQMAREEKAPFFDIEEVWENYAETCGKPRAWFMRDTVHANERGRQVLARILERYFAPGR
jgi:lysophospholipase L1-like esterase